MTEILAPAAAEARLKRMAFELLEANFEEEELILLGLRERGLVVAERLRQQLAQIASLRVQLYPLHKRGSRPEGLEPPPPGANFLIVDDVIYTGRAMVAALAQVMPYEPRRVQVAVLVDRGHRSFPVSADVVGLHLATTLQEYVRVSIGADQQSLHAFLD